VIERRIIEDRRDNYTRMRRHSSLGNRTPREFAEAFSIQLGLQGET